ncbi:MAG: hypothetical protein H7Z14_03520 [Anaerolineae bacterium]|nr:hypothetical protein [Phycisphaerae bacterium]
MKKTVAGLVGVFAVGMLGIGSWYVMHNQRADAEASQADARKDAGKMIPVQIVVKAPGETPGNQTLYVCGSAPNMGNWQAEAGVPLEKKPDGTWAGTVEVMNGVSYAFKINRGTWNTVERGPDDADVPNHEFTAADGKPVDVVVVAWVDHGTLTPNRQTAVSVIPHAKFPSKGLRLPHDVYVYLPPDYDTSKDRRYPTIYMQDGQNLFNEATSFGGKEWKFDETAQRLMLAEDMPGVIVVGVANNDDRNAEYTPPGMGTNDSRHPNAQADAYGKFLVEELKPFIDSKYRTMPDRAHTAIGGSAMGGLVSMYVAKTNPSVFGVVAVCSPWLRAPDGQVQLMPDFTSDRAWVKTNRWYIDMGSKGGGAGYPPNTDPKKASDPAVAQSALTDARALIAAFDSAGMIKGKDYVYEEVPNGEFNELAWQSRVEPMLRALYPATPATQPTASGN